MPLKGNIKFLLYQSAFVLNDRLDSLIQPRSRVLKKYIFIVMKYTTNQWIIIGKVTVSNCILQICDFFLRCMSLLESLNETYNEGRLHKKHGAEDTSFNLLMYSRAAEYSAATSYCQLLITLLALVLSRAEASSCCLRGDCCLPEGCVGGTFWIYIIAWKLPFVKTRFCRIDSFIFYAMFTERLQFHISYMF